MALIKSGTCKIDHLNNDGDGVSCHSGLDPESRKTIIDCSSNLQNNELIIPLTIEGEEVEYEIHKYRNNSQLTLKNIISQSPLRTKPKCEYFGKCGGCSLQHMNEARYKDFKASILQDDFFKTHLFFEPTIVSPENNKRRRLNLVFVKKSEELLLGLYKANSNNIISISKCIAAEQEISDLIIPIKNLLNEILLEKQKGEVFILKASNGIDIKIYVESERNIDDRKIRRLSFLAGLPNVIALSFYLNKNLKWSSRKEDPFVQFGLSKVGVSADSFLQPTADSDKLLSNVVLDFVEGSSCDHGLNPGSSSSLFRYSLRNNLQPNIDLAKPKTSGPPIKSVMTDKTTIPKIADLFCGRGTYSIPLAEAGHEVDGYEFDDKAIEDLKVASKNPPIKVYKRDLFHHPLCYSHPEFISGSSLIQDDPVKKREMLWQVKPDNSAKRPISNYSYIIINPPRTGAEKQCIELANSNVEKIIYVSCSIETFKRDAKILFSNYTITKLIGVDQFKWTKHLEIVCCFEKIKVNKNY